METGCGLCICAGRSQAGSKTSGRLLAAPAARAAGRGTPDMVYAPRVPSSVQGTETVATQDWLANELAEHGERSMRHTATA